MYKQARFITLLGLLLMGGALNSYAQMGSNVPQNNGGPGPGTNNGNVNTGSGGTSSEDLMNASDVPTAMATAPAKLTDLSTVSGKPSVARQFIVSGNVDNAELTAPQGFEISLQEAAGYASSLKTGHPPVTVWVRLTGNKPNGANTTISGDISMSGTSGQTRTSVTARMQVEGVVK